MALGKVYTLPLFRDGYGGNTVYHLVQMVAYDFKVNRPINSRAFVLLSLGVKFTLLA